MDKYIVSAFHQVCRDASPAEAHYVSLYANEPFYGGPEEGGWWGQDVVLIAYQEFSTREAAEAAKTAVEKLATELTAESKKEFGDHCLREMEWLEERGLDSDFLPEPDGETEYFVEIEEKPGTQVSFGCRHYE